MARVFGRFAQALKRAGCDVLLVADGLDTMSVKAHAKNGLQLVFDSLITAVTRISRHADLRKLWRITIFLPYDRVLASGLRDLDKLQDIHGSIRWSMVDLKEFIRRRMIVFSGKKSSFQQLWYDEMPAKILNRRYDIQEDSFEYILRHTFYRPRQLLAILHRITDDTNGRKVEEVDIISAVNACSIEFMNRFKEEFAVEFPRMSNFLERFRRQNAIMNYADFREIVISDRNIKGKSTKSQELIENLYRMSFFGVIRRPAPHEREQGQYYIPPTKPVGGVSEASIFDFYHKNGNLHALHQANAVRDFVCLHPVFTHALDLIPDKNRIVG